MDNIYDTGDMPEEGLQKRHFYHKYILNTRAYLAIELAKALMASPASHNATSAAQIACNTADAVINEIDERKWRTRSKDPVQGKTAYEKNLELLMAHAKRQAVEMHKARAEREEMDKD